MLADTGCTSHYITTDTHLQHEPTTPLQVQLPNGDVMTSSTATDIPFPHTSNKAKRAHIFPTLTTANLLSIGQLCDDGCIANFTKNEVKILKNNHTILQGKRNTSNGMWYVPIPRTSTHSSQVINAALHNKANIITKLHPTSDLIRFLHAAAFSPAKSTWIKAVEKGFFSSWPGLTTAAINKYLPQSIHTAMGHLDQERKNLRSTKSDQTTEDPFETVSPAMRTHDVYAHVQQNHIYSDQTGKFPVQSNRGHNYIMIIYDYDTNSIHAEPIKNRSTAELTAAYSNIQKHLQQIGCAPQLHTLDNEAPAELLALIENNNCKYEIVPPYVHRRNAAERAIRTFKNHLIAGISSVDPNFPLSLWDRLLPQAVRTLNMLRPTRINPNISADAFLHGQHDFNKHPMAPPGTKTIAHLKPQQRASWSKHGILGWYIGPSFEHYRCYRVYIPKTRSERIVDTVELFSTHSPTPTWDANKQVIQAARDLTTALQNPHAKIDHLHANKLDALKQLVSIFSPQQRQQHDTIQKIQPTVIEPRESYGPPRVMKIREAPSAQPVTPPASPPRVSTNTLEPHLIPPDDDCPTPALPAQPYRYMTRSKTAARHHYVSHIFTPNNIINNEPRTHHPCSIAFCNAIIDAKTGNSLEYRHLIRNPETRDIWNESCANEFGRLAQGVGNRVQGTNTIFFIPRHKVPKHKTVTYPRIVCDYRPNKTESNRTRITVGGNLLTYADEVYTATADLITAKLLINSVLSTKNAKCAIFDIKDFYLNSNLREYEYMRFRYNDIPDEIKQKYNLHQIVHSDGYVYTEIRKGMYGLPQAGIVANTDLQKHLAPFGYHPVNQTPGLWKHKTRTIFFSLVVDDFAIKYTNINDLHHLQHALQSKYKITIDLEAKIYCGIHLHWDYKKRKCELSMPGYISKLLHKLQHPHPNKPTHSPHKWQPPQYGSTTQKPVTEPQGPPLTQKETTRLQSIIGSLLYYARAVDPTLLPAINTIAMQQTVATNETMTAAHQLLDFVATHPNSTIIYSASDMILHVHSDASYLSAPKARSRIAGFFHLTRNPHNSHNFFNAPIHIECKVLRPVMSSAAEAELGALFENCKVAEIIRTTLNEMGHPQPPTTVITDNSTACGIANNNMKLKQSKTMDMRFFWVRDRVNQKHFHIQWERGGLNRADYFTKHHSPAHHKRMRPLYVNDSAHVINSITKHDMRGCINPISTYVQITLQNIDSARLNKDTCNNLTIHKASTHEAAAI